jgi:hypothetical protein
MKKLFLALIILATVPLFFAHGAIKPSTDANLDAYSYVFYLYYDNGQLFGDRDYQIKYDVLNETYSETSGAFKLEIMNSKSEVLKTATFDPSAGISGSSKIKVKAPYVANGTKVNFYDSQSRPIMTISVALTALCNDDGFCNSAGGENEKICSSDCQAQRTTPLTSVEPVPLDESLDLTMILIYAVGGLGVAVVGWLFWKWRKKKKEGNFLPPTPTSPTPGTPGL